MSVDENKGNYPLAVGSRRGHNQRTLPREEGTPLTVCVAALCDTDTIIGASDRMLTSDDVQFEPHQTKINSITSSIAIMIAGDTPLQMTILQRVAEEADRLITANPAEWLKIADVADLYARYYWEEVNKRAEREILAPQGLSMFDFHYRQNDFAPDFLRQIATEMLHYRPPEVEAIIAGVDTIGGHLYLVNNGAVTCETMVGFVAIGKGYAHANSQFMAAGHSRHKELPETLLLTLSAKKRAEVAPGVGPATDMFMIGSLGSFIHIRRDIRVGVEAIYNEIRKAEKRAIERSRKRVNEYVEQITSETTTQQQALPEDSGGDAPPNEAALRDGTETSQPENDNSDDGQAGSG